MPAPATTATARPDLGAAFMEITLEALTEGFIGSRVMRPMDVAEQAATFSKIKLASLLAEMNVDRANGGAYNRSLFEYVQDGYICTEQGAESPIDDRERRIYANDWDIDMIATGRARHAVMSKREAKIRDSLFEEAIPDAVRAVVNPWSNPQTATPINDIEGAVRRLRARGVVANQIALSWIDFRNARNSEQVIDRINSGGAGSSSKPSEINEAQLASIFDVEEVVVAKKLRNTANINQPINIEDIWTPGQILIHRAARTNDLQEACSSRMMHYTEDGSQLNGRVEEYREEQTRSKIIRVRSDTDEKILYREAIEWLTDAE